MGVLAVAYIMPQYDTFVKIIILVSIVDSFKDTLFLHQLGTNLMFFKRLTMTSANRGEIYV